jgi:hypothetical protein
MKKSGKPGRRLVGLVGITSWVILVAFACLAFSLGGKTSTANDLADSEPGRCWQFAVSADESVAYIPSSDRQSIQKVSLANGAILNQIRLNCGFISALKLSPTEALLAVALEQKNKVVLLNPFTLEPLGDVPTGERPRLLSFGSEGFDLCVLCPKGKELDRIRIDIPTLQIEKVLSFSSQPTGMTHFSDGVAIALPEASKIAVFDRDHNFRFELRVDPSVFWFALGTEMTDRGVREFVLDVARPITPPPNNPSAVLEMRDSTTFENLRTLTFEGTTFEGAGLRTVTFSICNTNACVWIASVLSEPGNRVIIVDGTSNLNLIGEKRTNTPMDTLSSGPSGLVYGLDRNHRKIFVFDPNNPSIAPDRIIEIQ